MGAQQAIVVVLVSGCSLYALWVMMPTVARRMVARGLLHLPLSPGWRAHFLRAASAASGCDCSGCDKVVDAKKPGQPQPIRFHRQSKR